MHNFTSRTVRVTSVALLALAVGSLSGCAIVDEAFHKQQSSSFGSAQDAPADSVAHESWVPADASDIRIVQTTIEEARDASILFTSGSALDPSICRDVPRLSAPSYAIEGAPDVLAADTVFACGDWSVVPSETGWLGWTPNHPDERVGGAGAAG